MSKILREYVSLNYDRNIIKELREKKAPIILTTILQRANIPNQNKRIYSREILEREMNNYQKMIGEARSTGELDHPQEAIISLANVSHIVREAWWQGDEVMGKIEILNTPKGKIAQDLLEARRKGRNFF